MDLYALIDEIIQQPLIKNTGHQIGTSVEGRNIEGFILGSGTIRISLIAGNHADEPVGPLLLKKLSTYLSHLPKTHFLLQEYSWWIVPHTNPDGAYRNRKWYKDEDIETNLFMYLQHVVRELPGADIEFGYPIANEKDALRPENEAVYEFWKRANAPFHMHVSLHGMAKSYGAWFLIDAQWKNRTQRLQQECARRTKALGYALFDLDRKGEKGFSRIAEGFCTRPDSEAMRAHFLTLGDEEMAGKFHPSSMESIRSLGGDCLTLVSEMPLFLFPKMSRDLQWPDPFLDRWNRQFALWKTQLRSGELTMEALQVAMATSGVRPMPWADQLRLQWQLIVSGIEAVN